MWIHHLHENNELHCSARRAYPAHMPFSDLWQAVRGLRRQPAFAAGVVAVLALAIGANTAMFAAGQRGPDPAAAARRSGSPDHLHDRAAGHRSAAALAAGPRATSSESNRTLDGIVSMFGWSANLTGRGDAERLSAMRVSADYFEVTGAQVAARPPVQIGRRAASCRRSSAMACGSAASAAPSTPSVSRSCSTAKRSRSSACCGRTSCHSFAMPKSSSRIRRPPTCGAATARRDFCA